MILKLEDLTTFSSSGENCHWQVGVEPSPLWHDLPESVMVSFGGVDLDGGTGVFELTTESDDEEFIYPLADGSEVIIPASSSYVVVRKSPGAGFEEVHSAAREVANRALDVYFGHGGRPLLMAHKDSPYVVGWSSPAGYALRIVGRVQSSTRFRARMEVLDADGNVRVQAPPPTPTWYESLRYYRVSESSTDLYDSFRNLYLAIEALLSSAIPPATLPNGRAEGDSRWLKRALGEAGLKVDLAPYAPASPEAPSNAIHQELYVDLRTAIFHAKIGRPTWAPQEWSSRAGIVAARFRYARMFRALAAEYLSTPYHGGGFAQVPWERLMESQLSNVDVL